MNGVGQIGPAFFGAAFIRTRPAPGADQGVYNKAAPSSGLKFLVRSKVTQFPLSVAEALHCNSSVRKMTSMYMGVFSYYDSYSLFGRVHEWSS